LLIRQVEEGELVHLTRRGSPAAVILSEAQYQQSRLRRRLETYLRALFDSHLLILLFDQSAADGLAIERAGLAEQGCLPAHADSEKAAIAAINQLTLVTRSSGDFLRFSGLNLENWFEV
jgi:predicted nucleic acid-binding protein